MLTDWLVCHTDGSGSDRHTDRLVGLLYSLSDSDGHDGWSDRLVYMVDEQSDDVGQSDRWTMRLTCGVTDGHVIDKLMGWWTDGSYDG